MTDILLEQQIKELERIIYQYDDMIFKNYDNENIDDDEIEKLQEKRDKTQEELNALKRKHSILVEDKEKQEIKVKQKKEKDENRIYEPFNDPKLNCNQIIIEVEKEGEWYYDKGELKFKEDFSVYKNLTYALMRLGDSSYCLHALMDYLNDNKHGFDYVLYFYHFNKLTGFKESAYRYALKALFYYKILQPTNRWKRNEKGICCQVFIFHSNFLEKDLPKEPFDKRKKEHLDIAAKNKDNAIYYKVEHSPSPK